MRSIRRMAACVAICASALLGVGVAPALAQPLDPVTPVGTSEVAITEGEGAVLTADRPTKVPGTISPQAVVDCGIINCTLYLSRGETRTLNNNILTAGGGVGALVASCGFLNSLPGAGSFFAFGCAAYFSLAGGYVLNQIVSAANTNQCVAFTTSISGTRVDNSGFCRA